MSVLWLLLGLLALTGECVSFSQMTLEMEGFAQGPSGTRIVKLQWKCYFS